MQELNELLRTLHPSQIKSFAADAQDESVEVTVLYEDEEHFELLDCHPHQGMQLSGNSIPTEIVLLFNAPITIQQAWMGPKIALHEVG